MNIPPGCSTGCWVTRDSPQRGVGDSRVGIEQTFNYAEAVLWGLFAIGFAWRAVQARSVRGRCLIAAAAFLLFGLSDIVETQTGAWWRPWWLLVWKALCLLVFMVLVIDHLRRRRTAGRS